MRGHNVLSYWFKGSGPQVQSCVRGFGSSLSGLTVQISVAKVLTSMWAAGVKSSTASTIRVVNGSG